MPQPIIVVMVKAPRAGEVKTRLVPPLSESDAASLATCFAQDTVLNAQLLVSSVLVAYAPADARNDLQPILAADLLWFEQDGPNLGERLDSVAEHVSSLGFSPDILIIPSFQSFVAYCEPAHTSGRVCAVGCPTSKAPA